MLPSFFRSRKSNTQRTNQDAGKREFRRLLVEQMEERRVMTADVALLLDINATANTAGSSPSNLLTIGSTTYFVATTPSAGSELWKTDGTANGTTLVKDIVLGPNGSSPSNLVNVNGTIFFTANDGVNGTELWKTDGTQAGTTLVSNIRSGATGSNPSLLTNLFGTVYFVADNGVVGNELWKSDGTSGGTVLVSDIISGATSSNPSNLVAAGTVGTPRLFFTVNDGVNGLEVWKSDSTSTAIVPAVGGGTTGMTAGATGSNPQFLTELDGEIYFSATDGVAGQELYRTNGSTTIRHNIFGPNNDNLLSSNPTSLTKVGSFVYFAANNGAQGVELWRTSIAGGPAIFADIVTGGPSSFPTNLANAGGVLYFQANNTVDGNELFRVSGATAVQVANVNVTGDSNPAGFTAVGSTVYFLANNGSTGVELFKTDGTGAGTSLVRDIVAGSGTSSITNLTNRNGQLLFIANDGAIGAELWRSDGTLAGTQNLIDMNGGTLSSNPAGFARLGAFTYFAATTPAGGTELWRTDSTTGGTNLFVDIVAGTGSSSPSNFLTIGSTLYFTATRSTEGTELWKTDGTVGGTVLVADIAAGTGSSSPSQLTNVNGTLFFSATTSATGVELFKSSGTSGTTSLVKDVNPGATGSSLANLTAVGSTLFFSANDGTAGVELWSSDGTTVGTNLLLDINATGNSNPNNFVNANGTLYFAANDGAAGIELWTSGGTAGTTTLAADIFAGGSSSNPTSLVNLGSNIYFSANSGTGAELFKFDGTTATMVMDINATTGSNPSLLTVVESNIYFSANDGVVGSELWKSDGTNAGTSLLKDVEPGSAGSSISNIVVANKQIVFSAITSAAGQELWYSDGTQATTNIAGDIAPGISSSVPSRAFLHDYTVFFGATNDTVGREIFSALLNSPPTDIASTPSSIAENSAIGTVVGALTTVDPNVGDTHTYSLVAGTGSTDNASFSIVGSDLVAQQTFNFEAKSSYSIRVRTEDSTGYAFEKILAISIVDVNEAPTALTLTPSSVSLAENTNTTSSVKVADIVVTDDALISGNVLTLTGPDASKFVIVTNGANKELHVAAGTALDFETQATLNVTVNVDDATVGVNPDASSAFVLNLTDANDAPSDIAITGSTIAENQGNGVVIGTFAAADQDASNTHTFSLVAGVGSTDNAAFAISAGQLVSNSTYDFETKNSYSIRVRATDNGGMSFEKVFTITITDVNDAPTGVLFTPNPGNLAENANTASSIKVADIGVVDDALVGPGGNVLTLAGADAAKFEIVTVGPNRELHLKAGTVLNFEVQPSFAVTLNVDDASVGGSIDGSGNFTLNITNSNEAPTDIALTPSSIPENSVVGTAVGVLSTTDPDVDTFTYTLVAGTGSSHNGQFTIVGNELRPTIAFNFETTPTRLVRIRSTDAGGLFTEKAFVVTITNVNEKATNITLSSSSVAENQASGTPVGTLTSTDPDVGDTHTYSLVAGTGSTDNSSFQIVSNELRTNASFDFETKSSYSIRIRTTDAGGQTFEKVFTIAVTNVNEAPTAINLTPSSTSLPENTNTSSSVKVADIVIVDDALQGAGGNVLTLTGADAASFVVVTVGPNKELHLASGVSLDFETKTSYNVTVQVDDATLGSTPDATAAFALTITNSNDAPSDIGLSGSSVNENVPANTTIGGFTTTDQDSGNTFTYTLVAGTGSTDNASFSIVGSNLVTSAALNFEVKNSYSVRVRSTDGGGLFTEKVFNVSVLDVNEAPTSVGLAPGSLTIQENTNTASPINVSTVSIVDDALNGGNALSLSGADASSFELVGNTLRLKAGTTLNAIAKPSFVVVVNVDDATVGSTPDAQSTFTLNVTEVNDAPTDILLSSSTVKENSLIGSSFATLSAQDPDLGDSHTFTLVPGTGSTDNASFAISGNQLQVLVSTDFEVKSSYSIRVRGTDAGGLFFEKAVTINVGNEPEGTTGNDVFTMNVSGANVTVLRGTTNLGVFPLNGSPITVYGLGGTDSVKIVASATNDTVLVSAAGVTLNGTLLGMNSIETLTVETGAGSDVISMDARPVGVTTLNLTGGANDDSYVFNTGNVLGTVVLDEVGGGNDWIDLSQATVPVTINLSLATVQAITPNLSLNLKSGATFENIAGGSAGDTLLGNSLNNIMVGGAGNDLMSGSALNDTYRFDMDSNLGVDTITDTAGVDTIDFSSTTSVGAIFDLALATAQVVNANLTLTNTTATIENIHGTHSNDTLFGNSVANRIEGNGGDDLLKGFNGSDTYLFNTDIALGVDTIDDAVGVETLDFSAALTVGASIDLAIATLQVVSPTLSLVLTSGTTMDNLIGSQTNDSLRGNAGANVITGNSGNDAMRGLGGNDTYRFNTSVSLGSDFIEDTAGTDLIDFSSTVSGSGVSINLGTGFTQVVNPNLSLQLASVTSIENITGSALNDTIIGNSLPNLIIGGLGDDSLSGGSGNDTYTFDSDLAIGTDTVNDTSGTDLLNFATTTTKAISINLGITTVQAITNSHSLQLLSGSAIESVTGGSLSDTIVGNSLANVLTGGSGDDNLSGNAGDDTLVGGLGNDVLNGGSDNDTYTFDGDLATGSDTVDESAGGHDTLNFSTTTTVGITIDLGLTTMQAVSPSMNLTLLGSTQIEQVIGGGNNDTITGNSLNNILLGGSGVDTISGGTGRDVLIGGLGTDTLIGGDDDDLLMAGTTIFDANQTALLGILQEWSSGNSYAARVANLRAGTTGAALIAVTNVKKDNVPNTLTGGNGQDWYFANVVGGSDLVTDLAVGEIIDEL